MNKIVSHDEKVKIRIFKFFLLYRQEYFCANNSVRVVNDVIDILTSEDMENTPLESRMLFRMNLKIGVFSTKLLLSI